MPGVFISYRRDDQAGFAGRLGDALTSAFGEENVFRDIEDIHPGEDFVAAIERNLATVDVVLVMIGPAWLTASRNGVRRLDEPDDFVRREIEAALASGKAVLPVLVGSASMPEEKALPPTIAALARRQSFVLSDTGWTSDVARLVETIRRFVPMARRGLWKQRWLLVAACLAGVALLAVGLKAFWPVASSGESPPASVRTAQDFAGRWTANVKYDWGAEYAENFDLRWENGEVRGSAGYLGLARTIEQGRVAGETLEFITHTEDALGDGQRLRVTHSYRGVLKGDQLNFMLESSGGYSPHPAVEFSARRAAP